MTARASYAPPETRADWGKSQLEYSGWGKRERSGVPHTKREVQRQRGILRQRVFGELLRKALLHRPQAVFSLLNSYVDERDPKQLGNLVDRLLEVGRDELGAWIFAYGAQWVEQRRTALAAVVEAAVRVSAPGTEALLDQIFRSADADPLVVSVAAQRARMLSITDPRSKRRLWDSFKGLIDLWEMSPSHEADLARALPSLPYVGGARSVPYLTRLIESASPPLANSAALGLLDWASGSIGDIQPLNDAQEQALFRSLTRRLRREGNEDLRATLVWAIGATARERDLPDASSIVADSFKSSRGLEDAAALRAANLLVRRCGEGALSALAKALGGPKSDAYMRFFTALVRTGRPR